MHAASSLPLSDATPSERYEFIRATYNHVLGALGCFAFLSWILFQVGFGRWFYLLIAEYSLSWLVVLGGFMLIGRMSSHFAETENRETQYVGLALAILAEGIVFAPLIFAVHANSGAAAIQSGVAVTIGMVCALTEVVRRSRTDFSHLEGILRAFGWLSGAFIVSSILFGFTLGALFSYAMIALATGFILYDTSRILKEEVAYNYVSAALQLFLSINLLLWYVLSIFGFGNDD